MSQDITDTSKLNACKPNASEANVTQIEEAPKIKQ